MNTRNHKKNAGCFKRGADGRRNLKGQTASEAVALGALLKKYIADEGGKICELPGHGKKQTKAQALAATIWKRAILGEFQFVNLLLDRLMGKQKESGQGEDAEAIDRQLARIADEMMKPAMLP
jgi:hypothetical protein